MLVYFCSSHFANPIVFNQFSKATHTEKNVYTVPLGLDVIIEKLCLDFVRNSMFEDPYRPHALAPFQFES